MENKNFERELPQGYRLDVIMDATRGKFMVIMLLLSVLIMILCAVPMVLPFLWGMPSGEINLIHMIIALIALLIYVVLHELVHGAVYKKMTGEPLTYGFSLTCAYCGVPKIYTYRKCALYAVLAPFVIFSIIFIPLMIIAWHVSLAAYVIVAFVAIQHFSGCSGDLFVACMLLFRYRDGRTLMNDTGPRMALFVYEGEDAVRDEKTARIAEEIAALREKK
jgi:hypothetical protein